MRNLIQIEDMDWDVLMRNYNIVRANALEDVVSIVKNEEGTVEVGRVQDCDSSEEMQLI